MKKNVSQLKWLIAAIGLFVSFSGFSQEDESSSRIKINSAWIFAGSTWQNSQSGTLSDFRRLAPASSILKEDLAGYDEFLGLNFSNQRGISGSVGIQFLDKEKKSLRANPTLRLGFSYRNGEMLYGTLNRETSTVIDTLISSQTGAQLFLDSIYYETISMNTYRESLMLDASLIFESHPGSRWTLFGGLGLSAGYSFNSYTEIFYFDNVMVEAAVNGGFGSVSPNNQESNIEVETFNNDNSFLGEIYIPLGVDFTVGKKREFWKKIHLFYEARPGMQFTSIPELRSISRTQIHQGFGVKLKW
jgi:hypothetical protein